MIAAELADVPTARVCVVQSDGRLSCAAVGSLSSDEALESLAEAAFLTGRMQVGPAPSGAAGFRVAHPVFDAAGHVAGVVELADPRRPEGALSAGRLDALRRLVLRVADGAGRTVPGSDGGELVASMFHQSPSFMALLRGESHQVQHANPGFERLMGNQPLIGRPMRDILGGGPAASRYVTILDRVLAIGRPYSSRDARYAVVSPDGSVHEERIVDFVFQPIRNAAGAAIGILVQGTDVTERSQAVSALQEAERRRRLMFDLAWGLREAGSEEAMLNGAAARVGQTLDLRQLDLRVVLDDGRIIRAGFWRRDGETDPAGTGVEQLVEVRRDGRVRLLLDLAARTGAALPDAELDLAREAADAIWDAVEGRRAAVGLRRTQDRYRALVNHIDVGICIVEPVADANADVPDFLILETNPAFERRWGAVGAAGRRLSEACSSDADDWRRLCAQTLSGVRTARSELFREIDARWLEIDAMRIGENDDNRIALLFTDVTERRRVDERRTLLNQELAHRLKNNLALVSSIVTQTLRSASDIGAARQALGDRIMALAKAHDVLLTGQREAASVDVVLRSALALHDPGERVELAGPLVPLGAKASLSLALIVHELATNAAKYGALSAPDGHVRIEWRLSGEGTDLPLLELHWVEAGGPPVRVPVRTSFGTRLIRMGLSGDESASVDFNYVPAGVRCRIVAPLRDLQGDEAGV